MKNLCLKIQANEMRFMNWSFLIIIIIGGEIVSTFGKPELVKIGKCDLIQQIQIGDETLLKFR